MPLNDNISILAILGGGEPIDITSELAAEPLLMDLVVVLAQGAAAKDLVRLSAKCSLIKDDRERGRQIDELLNRAARQVETYDKDRNRRVREFFAAVARFANSLPKQKNDVRLYGMGQSVEPREEATRRGQDRPGARSTGIAGFRQSSGPLEVDGRLHPAPASRTDRVEKLVYRFRRKPGAPRD
jgi:hypothetical protein